MTQERRDAADTGRAVRIDLVISILGVLIAAFAAIFSYTQIDLLKHERLTPYRAILFSERLDSYRTLVKANTDLDELRPPDLVEWAKLRQQDFPQKAAAYVRHYDYVLRTEAPLWPNAARRSWARAQRAVLVAETVTSECRSLPADACVDRWDKALGEIRDAQAQLQQDLASNLQADRLDNFN